MLKLKSTVAHIGLALAFLFPLSASAASYHIVIPVDRAVGSVGTDNEGAPSGEDPSGEEPSGPQGSPLIQFSSPYYHFGKRLDWGPQPDGLREVAITNAGSEPLTGVTFQLHETTPGDGYLFLPEGDMVCGGQTLPESARIFSLAEWGPGVTCTLTVSGFVTLGDTFGTSVKGMLSVASAEASNAVELYMDAGKGVAQISYMDGMDFTPDAMGWDTQYRDFPIGQTTRYQIQVANTGNGPLFVNDVRIGWSSYPAERIPVIITQDTTCTSSTTLNEEESCVVTVEVPPDGLVTDRTDLIIGANNRASENFGGNFYHRRVFEGYSVSFSEQELDFGMMDAPGNGQVRTLTFTNTSADAMTNVQLSHVGPTAYAQGTPLDGNWLFIQQGPLICEGASVSGTTISNWPAGSVCEYQVGVSMSSPAWLTFPVINGEFRVQSDQTIATIPMVLRTGLAEMAFGDFIGASFVRSGAYSYTYDYREASFPMGTSVDYAFEVVNNGNAPLPLYQIYISQGAILTPDEQTRIIEEETTCSESEPIPPGGACVISVHVPANVPEGEDSTLVIVRGNYYGLGNSEMRLTHLRP